MSSLPFTYRTPEGDRSLLGSAITGSGFAVAVTPTAAPAVVRLGPVTSPTFAEGELEAYRAYYEQYYAREALLGHEAALQAGGAPLLAAGRDGRPCLMKGLPDLPMDLTGAQVASALSTRGLGAMLDGIRGGINGVGAALLPHLKQAFKDYCTDWTWEIGRTTSYTQWKSNIVGSREISYYGAGTLGSAFKLAATTNDPLSANWQTVFREVSEMADPLKLTWRFWIYTNGTSGDITELVYRAKVIKHTRYAFLESEVSLTFSETSGVAANPSGSGTKNVPRSSVFHKTCAAKWITKGSGETARLALQATNASLSSETHSKTADWYGVWPASPSVSGQPGTTVGTGFDGFTEGTSNPLYSWDGVEPIVITAGDVGTFNPPVGSVSFAARAAAATGFDQLDLGGVSLSAVTASSTFASRGIVAQKIGSLLTDVPGLSVLMEVDGPIAMHELSPVMPVQTVLRQTVAGLPSSVVAAALSALGDHPELAGHIADLRAKPRMFWGVASKRVPVPAAGVLGRTHVGQEARKAGVSIYDEVLIPKDDDDPGSTEVTFKQGSNAIESFISESRLGKRGSIVAVQQVGDQRASPAMLTPYLTDVSGVLTPCVVIDGVEVTELTEDQLDAVYAQLVVGGPVHLRATRNTKQLAAAFVSPHGVTTYPTYFDKLTDELFGRSYGSITENVAGATDPIWSMDGQLRGGYPSDPELWTPEFWLVYGGTKMWKVEEVVGGLVASPFGVGAFPKAS